MCRLYYRSDRVDSWWYNISDSPVTRYCHWVCLKFRCDWMMILCIKFKSTILSIWVIIQLIIIIYLPVCYSLIFFFVKFIIKETTRNQKNFIFIVFTTHKSLCSLENYNILNDDVIKSAALIWDYISCHEKKSFNSNICNRNT